MTLSTKQNKTDLEAAYFSIRKELYPYLPYIYMEFNETQLGKKVNGYHSFAMNNNIDFSKRTVNIKFLANFSSFFYTIIKSILNEKKYRKENIKPYKKIISFLEKTMLSFNYFVELTDDCIYDFVNLKPETRYIKEQIDDEAIYIISKYYKQDNLKSKKDVLTNVRDYIYSHEFTYINKANDLNILNTALNNFNISHNNIDKTSKDYKNEISILSSEQLEKLYDFTINLFAEMIIKEKYKEQIAFAEVFKNKRKKN